MTKPDLETGVKLLETEPRVDFAVQPDAYKHWKVTIDGRVARLALDVDETATLMPGYELKLNSYDLGVDIELYDAVQRLRFEHPEVAAVVVTSNKPRIFCAGANIRMLGQSSHALKVNFCKFTNETRNGIEDATENSGQTYLCAINGTAAVGSGPRTAVSLPELPLLAVLPGTGGLTRLVDKRGVRHDHADFICTTSEGIRSRRAVDWLLVDELVAPSRFEERVVECARQFAERSDRPANATGIELTPLNRRFDSDGVTYDHVNVDIDRAGAAAYITVHGPTVQGSEEHGSEEVLPSNPAAIQAAGTSFWPLALARELDDVILHLRLNEPEIGTWVFRTVGDNGLVEAADRALLEHAGHWLVREITLYLKRTLKRLDVSSRSLIALIEPGSCFTGTLLELALASDRTYMLEGAFEDSGLSPAAIRLTGMNFGPLTMVNGLSRLHRRFLSDPAHLDGLKDAVGRDLAAGEAEELGLVTFIPDDIDWEDEVRLAIEERASFSPDALTGMEANLRFPGPETLESKIFARLSAWQNWIFQRSNASGEEGALKLYGSGRKSTFDKKRA